MCNQYETHGKDGIEVVNAGVAIIKALSLYFRHCNIPNN